MERMVAHLGRLVEAESFTEDPHACAVAARVLADIGVEVLGTAPELVEVDGRTHVVWRLGNAIDVLLVGHLDTVWPIGTISSSPFRVDDGVARGPGVFDMKAGIVQGLHAVAGLADRSGVALLFTTDEERGSQSSRALIEELAAGARAALVLEPSTDDGALKIGRKGTGMYELVVEGKAAHAGLEPEKGANALVALAGAVLRVATLGDAERGTTVTPTVARAGSATNVVPALAQASIDVRTTSAGEEARVDHAIRSVSVDVAGARLRVTGGPNRPPLPAHMATALFDRAQACATRLGVGPLTGVEVGGGSDGNFTAALGVPTLDGLGGVGGGAHAESEHVVVAMMPERTALVRALIEDLQAGS
jgi:glutamate carboxypeptidase